MVLATNSRSWNYDDVNQLHRIAQGGDTLNYDIHIMRIAPGDSRVTLEWQDFSNNIDSTQYHYGIFYTVRGSEGEQGQLVVTNNDTSATIFGLDNGVDYEFTIAALKVDTQEKMGSSPSRIVRPGIVPGVVVNYIHPEDYTYNFSGRSPASPSIARLPNGRLVASHDVYWGKGGQNLSKLFQSEDDGKTWTFLTDLYPCFWGKLFVHQDDLYMLATSTEYGALLIGRSQDGGKSWTAPVQLLEGGSREKGGPHKAPMPVIEYGGRLWTTVEHGSWTLRGHDVGVLSAPADADLLHPANWTVTPFLKYDSEWPGTIEGGIAPSLLEGNIIPTLDGGLVNLLRYNTTDGTPNYGRAIMINVDPQHPGAPLTFGRTIDFHGNNSKFTVYWDETSQRYWSLVNRVTSANVKQRNVLTLVCSKDLCDWRIVKDVLNYEDHDWPEDNTKVGFQYVDWIFDGEDILYLSRTAINGAFNYHNANYITFHRLERFRDLWKD